MKKLFYLFGLLISIANTAFAQWQDIIELPRPPIPTIKEITSTIPGNIQGELELKCAENSDPDFFHFQEPDKVIKQYFSTNKVTFDWTAYYREGLLNVRNWADRYEVIIAKNGVRGLAGGKDTNMIADGVFTSGPPQSHWDYIVPCDGWYTITVIAYEKRSFLASEDYKPRCSIMAAFYVSVALEPPAAQAHVVCKPGTYRLHIPNPQEADMLLRTEDPTSDPGQNPGAFKRVGEKDGNGNFYYDVTVNQHEAFWLLFKKRGCYVVPRSDLTPDTVYTNIYSYPSPTALLLVDLKQDQTTLDTTNLVSNDCSASFVPLDLKLPTIESALIGEMQTLKNDTENDMIQYAIPTFEYGWDSTKYITDTTYKVLDAELGGYATVKVKKVCWKNLPRESGSCRTYTMHMKVSLQLALKDWTGKKVIDTTFTCYLDSIQTKTVCKLITAPPPSIVTACQRIDSVQIPKQGYYSMKWVNSAGDQVFDDDPDPNPFVYKNEDNRGFSYPDFSKKIPQGGHQENYTLTTHYITSQGRISPPGIFQIVILPKPSELNAGTNTDTNVFVGSYTITRPTTNDPDLKCEETGTYKDLSFANNGQDYINEVTYLLDTLIPNLNPLFEAVHPTFYMDWSSTQTGCGIHDDYISPLTQVMSDRVCYDDLPDEKGACCMYEGRIIIKSNTILKGPDSTVLAQQQIDCTPTLLRAEVCRAVTNDTVLSGCAAEHPGLDLGQLFDGCDQLHREFQDVCPSDSVTIGTDLKTTGYTYTYVWDDDNGFVVGDINDQKVTVSYAELPVMTGFTKMYKQTVHGEPPLPTLPDEDYIHCAALYKCNSCMGGRMIQVREMPKQNGNSLTAELHLYPNPADHELNILYAFEQESRGSILITNMIGQTVEVLELIDMTGAITIPTGQLREGSYICTLIVNGARLQSKFFTVNR